jgi:class 3 adenylate cyclase
VPTLIVHRTGDRNVDVKNARYAAEHIPGARYVELEGDDHLPWIGDSDAIVEEIRSFLSTVAESGWSDPLPERVLATVLFTDIVGGTAKAVELGDAQWRELIAAHHARVRAQLARFGGKEIDTAGDGFFASFDGPARAIRCACAIRDSVRELGIDVRAGLHTGECEEIDGKVGGIAVITGARIAAEADANEVLVSATVRDLVAGSGLAFEDRGVFALKGLPEQKQLFAVS